MDWSHDEKKILLLNLLILTLNLSPCYAHSLYGETLCHTPDFFCMIIKKGESWESLFPNPEEQDIVKRINRMNVALRPGMTIAVPKKH